MSNQGYYSEYGTKCTNEKWVEYCKMPQIEARKLIQFPNSTLYASKIGIAICFSCDQLVYIGKRTKNIENNYYSLNYEEYLKTESVHKYEEIYALHHYKLWMKNVIKKLIHAKEVAKRIQACIIIQRKVVEW
ncbi:23068_t:CDS:2, partial [Gigaspora margarita]